MTHATPADLRAIAANHAAYRVRLQAVTAAARDVAGDDVLADVVEASIDLVAASALPDPLTPDAHLTRREELIERLRAALLIAGIPQELLHA